MYILEGEYNIARIMLPEDNYLEDETTKQIYSFLNHPALKGDPVVVMPDAHKGAGSCIGFTMKMNDYIMPFLVGVDIGCGVRSVNLGKVDLDLVKIDRYIKNNIPSGFDVNDRMVNLCNFDFGFNSGEGIDYRDISEVSERIDSSIARNCQALGTLGGGNHFIEIGEDQSGDKWLTVHSGSRKFGLDIANYHQRKAAEFVKKVFAGASAYKGLEYLLADSQEGEQYLMDMQIAQRFATMNRIIMIDKISQFIIDEFIRKDNPRIDVIFHDEVESIHNFIDFKDNIIRKGAIRSYEGEDLVIPFNMEDGLIIGTGKSNKKWNYSAPHGAGRVLSRKKAKAQLNLENAKKSMADKGIYTTSLSKETLDEVKEAYKDKDMIIDAISETVDIKYFIKPIYNFKSK